MENDRRISGILGVVIGATIVAAVAVVALNYTGVVNFGGAKTVNVDVRSPVPSGK